VKAAKALQKRPLRAIGCAESALSATRAVTGSGTRSCSGPHSWAGTYARASTCSRAGAARPPPLLVTMLVAGTIRQVGRTGRATRSVTGWGRRTQVTLHRLINWAAAERLRKHILWKRQIERPGMSNGRLFLAGIGPSWQCQSQGRRQQDQTKAQHERIPDSGLDLRNRTKRAPGNQVA